MFRGDTMNNRSLARLLIPVVVVLSILYTYRRTTPTWVPYPDTITLRSAGVDRSIQMSSFISVRYDQPLEVVSIGGVLALIDRKWILGPIARIRDIPRPPWQPGDLEMHVTILARKNSQGPRSDCFDSKDILQSGWVPIPHGRWNINFPDHEWMVGSDWESIKIAISVRDRGADHGGPAAFPTGGTYILDFGSQEGTTGLRATVRRNIFSTIAREFEKCP
jgi:hypothetical protein